MRRELDYIEDDRAALCWALGCVLASYKARLAAWAGFRTRAVLRHAATSGAVMLLIGLALLENAGGQTEPPRPAVDETTCDRPDVSADIDPTLSSSGTVAIPRDMNHSAQAPDPFERRSECADPLAAKYRTP
jgi:hypothetical protein